MSKIKDRMRTVMIPTAHVHQVLKQTQFKAVIPYRSGKTPPYKKGKKVSLRYWKNKQLWKKNQIEFAQAEIVHVYRTIIHSDKVVFRHGKMDNKKALNKFAKKCGFKSWTDFVKFYVSNKDIPFECYVLGWRQIEYTFQGE